jgi:acylphosphatase
MDVAGWVRNLPDGAVELEVWGDRPSLDRFEEQLFRGPRGAQVADVIRSSIPEGAVGPRRFSILG